MKGYTVMLRRSGSAFAVHGLPAYRALLAATILAAAVGCSSKDDATGNDRTGSAVVAARSKAIITVTSTQTATGTVTSTAYGTNSWTSLGTVTTTALGTVTSTALGTVTTTALGSQTWTSYGTVTSTALGTQTWTSYGTVTSTALGTVTSTALGTVTSTALGTVTTTALGTVTSTGLGTGTVTATVTNTATMISTSTQYVTVTGTVSGTWTVTAWSTGSWTGPATKTQTTTNVSPNQKPVTSSITGTKTATDTSGYNSGVTKTVTGTVTQFATWAGTTTVTMSDTATGTNHYSGSGTRTVSGTASNTGTATGTWTYRLTSTATQTAHNTVTNYNTLTNYNTVTVYNTVTSYNTVTVSNTLTNHNTVTVSNTLTNHNTVTISNTVTNYNTVTNSNTVTNYNTVTNSNTGIVTTTGTGTATATSTNTVTIIVPFPVGLGVDTRAVGANGSLQVGDRSKSQMGDGTPGPMSNAGSGVADIGVDCQIGSLTSLGSVSLRERAHILGNLTTSGTVNPQNDTVVTGTTTQNAVLTPLSIMAWSTVVPATNMGNVLLYPGSNATVNPGAYTDLTVYTGSNMTLTSGTYYATSFDIEPQATLTLNMTSGPIVVYATGAIVYRGTMVNQGGTDGAFMLVELGDTDMAVENTFIGTIVVPNATLTLGATVPLTLQGQFYGQNIVVRPDTTLAAKSFPWTALNPPSGGECWSADDTDNDGVWDCHDKCPYDKNKTEPGVCGCNIPDVNSDSDVAPDCIDQCPTDPNKTTPGQCGCLDKGFTAAGTPCTDRPCPQLGPQEDTVCNGMGACGDVSSCIPNEGDCKLLTLGQMAYYFCDATSMPGEPPPAGTPQANAENACRQKGMALISVEDATKNENIRRMLSAPIWLGANSLSTAGVWRWATAATDDGSQFWSGGANGSRVGNMYVNWAANAPADGQCAAMNPADGKWFAADCGSNLGYVCEYWMPWASVPPLGGPPVPLAPPPMDKCTPESASIAQLPQPVGNPPSDAAILAAQDELLWQIGHPDAGQGAARNPPGPGSTCPQPDPSTLALGPVGPSGLAGVGCQITNQKLVDGGAAGECTSDEQCQRNFGASYVCREIMDDPQCPKTYDPNTDASPCKERAWCVVLDCSGLTLPGDNNPCDEIQICNPGSEYDAGVDPDTRWDPPTFDPGPLFPGGTVPDASPSSAFNKDDPNPGEADAGVNHPWCKFTTQNPAMPAADQPGNNSPSAKTDQSKAISLSFDPKLTFNINISPIAMGETNLSIRAGASMGATVKINSFLGMPSMEKTILYAGASLALERCTFRTDDTRLELFGINVPIDDYVPILNTSINPEDPSTGDPNHSNQALYNVSKACTDALNTYQVWSGRVKKSFRDAQQLLKQYHALAGMLNKDSLCAAIESVGPEVHDFPGGAKCYENESVEDLINRFVYYYQAPGIGQVTKMKAMAGGLKGASAALIQGIIGALAAKWKEGGPGDSMIEINFLKIDHPYAQTIANVPFAIGPIPCVLQVDIAANYGIVGNFGLDLNFPTDILFGDPPVYGQQIAHARAQVVPYASAKLSAFVGAGFDYGPFSATLGIEGSVSLAKIRLPMYGGAGLDVDVLQDYRPIPTDVGPPVSIATNAFSFGIPKNFTFHATYDYGIRVDVDDILAGAINARLRIKFGWFFSRTWRKQIAKFNGMSFHKDILEGQGTIANVNVNLSRNTPPLPPTGASAQLLGAPDGTKVDDATATTAVGNATMGISESEVPLTVLAYLPGPGDPNYHYTPGTLPDGGVGVDGGPTGPGQVTFEKLAGLFYDNQCCAKLGDACEVDYTPYPPCCPGTDCTPDTNAPSVKHCTQGCRAQGVECTGGGQCCPVNDSVICNSSGLCGTCSKGPPEDSLGCTTDADCCYNYACYHGDHCVYQGVIY